MFSQAKNTLLVLSRGAAKQQADICRHLSASSIEEFDLFNPTNEHQTLRNNIRKFVEAEVDPQALSFNRFNSSIYCTVGPFSLHILSCYYLVLLRDEEFNKPLFHRVGELGLLGITIPTKYGGSGRR